MDRLNMPRDRSKKQTPSRWRVLAVAAAVVVSVGVSACAGSGSDRPTLPSVSRSTTTTEPATATTTEPDSTTTTQPDSTGTSQPDSTATTDEESQLRTVLVLPQQEDTATVSETSETTDTSDAWVWVIVAALVILIGVGIAMLVRHRRAAARARQLWREEGGPIFEHATTTAALLAEASGRSGAMSQASEAVRRAGLELDRLAADAPSSEAGAAAAAVAARLRSVLFDVESDALLASPTRGRDRPEWAATGGRRVDSASRRAAPSCRARDFSAVLMHCRLYRCSRSVRDLHGLKCIESAWPFHLRRWVQLPSGQRNTRPSRFRGRAQDWRTNQTRVPGRGPACPRSERQSSCRWPVTVAAGCSSPPLTSHRSPSGVITSSGGSSADPIP